MYSNADALMNKRTELEALVEIHKPEVISITEVKPKNCRFEIQPSEVQIDGYELFHTLDKNGRGICLHIKHELKPTMISIEDSFSECVFVKCKLANNESLVLGTVYRSPSIKDESMNNKLNKTIMEIAALKADHLVIVGDFNFPEIDWKLEKSKAGENHGATKFLEMTKDAYLIQHQQEPTRIREGQNPTLDDLVLTNREDIVVNLNRLGALGKSDHCTLLLELNMTSPEPTRQEKFNYHKADFDEIRAYLHSINWKEELKDKTAEEQWSVFVHKIEEAKKKFIPKRKPGLNTRKKWLDDVTLEYVREKHRKYRRWLRTKDKEDFKNYAKARSKAKRACRKAKAAYERKLADEAKNNQKPIWSYVKAKMCTRSGISDLTKDDGTTASTDKDKAEVLNNFFQSVFTCEPDDDLPKPPTYNVKTELRDFEITAQEVNKLLKGLKTNKSAGMDGIPAILLVEAAEELTEPVTSIFRKSLEEGHMPNDWRKASITPIFKKGNRSSPNNYRPVSLTSILCKVMETLVKKKILEHLTENDLICKEQHGFTPGRSCCTQLLDTLDFWTQTLDDGGNIDAVYTDFKKAFDSVPHRRLMLKLNSLGIKGKVHAWVKDFLSERTQIVTINGETSEEGRVTSGIPQGSVLGPLLFVAYINDLPQHATNEVRIFADDTKLFARSEAPEARAALQKDIDSLCKWSNDWLLSFHPQKCCVMRLGNNPPEHTYTMTATTNGEETKHSLNESNAEKDLGVIIDNKLNFSNHISQATGKANRTLGVLRRSFDHLSDKTFIQLYKSLVRPMLEYGHSIWTPAKKNQQQEVETVQRRATKLIGRLKNKPYSQRLRELKLPSLQFRRLRGDMIDTYKYLTGIYKTSSPTFKLHDTRDTRGHSKKLSKSRHNLQIRKNFLSERVVTPWNSLPEDVVSAPSLNTFKNRLDRHWVNHPMLYDPDCFN